MTLLQLLTLLHAKCHEETFKFFCSHPFCPFIKKNKTKTKNVSKMDKCGLAENMATEWGRR